MKTNRQSILRLMLSAAMLTMLAALQAQPVVQEINKGWRFHEARLSTWHDAEVPGLVHTDLMRNDIIGDPFFRLNERGVQWVDKEDWEYVTTFTPTDELMKQDNIQIHCFGLDTYADVYLNDELVLKADNMFREWKASVKHLLKAGENKLRVYLHSPIKVDLPKYEAEPYYPTRLDQSENGGIFDKKVSIWARKAGYHYGWDWGPRLVTIGIWRPIQLEAWSNARIKNVYFMQPNVTKKLAQLKNQVTVTSDVDAQGTISVKDMESGKTLATMPIQMKKGENIIYIPVNIKNPRLWWTNGLGEQYRYRLKTELVLNGKTIDAKENKIGVRSLRVVRTPDKDGVSFYFEINGRPVFAKGANYVPMDNFMPHVTDQRYRRLISDCAKSNMNMLRIWGGGVYEDDRFYDLCDEYGILIWQDFMFACAMFPAKGEFLENIRQEAIDNVVRLRNFACIALWCGNNENQDGWFLPWGWHEMAGDHEDEVWKQFQDQYYVVIPEVVKKYAPETTYWPSSAFSDYNQLSDPSKGDCHYWDVWHGQKPIENYNTAKARFFSEYGFQSFPEFISVKQYAPKKEDWDIHSEVMMSHQRDGDHGNDVIKYYMDNEYRQPTDFRRFLYVGHVLQGDAIKTAMEAFRRDMPYCMGSLYWQIDDCWPVASWASIDYYGRWKAQQYYARKAYDQILVSPLAQGDNLNIYVVSDESNPTKGTLDVKVMKFDGTIVSQITKNVTVPANTSTIMISENIEKLLKGEKKNDVVVHAAFTTKNGKTYDNNYVMLKQKDINYPHVDIDYSFAPVADGYDITLKAPKFARAVFIEIDDINSVLSDNYFDMLPGETRTIRVNTNLTPDKLKETLNVQSLAD